MRIAFVGQPSSGKDTAAAYLVERHGYHHVSTGDLVRFYVAEHQLGEPTRQLLQDVANTLRAEHGAEYFARLALTHEQAELVVTGFRNPAEVTYAREHGVAIALIVASPELRYQRAQERGRVGEHISFAEFLEVEAREAVNPNPDAQNTAAVVAMATHILTNEGDLAHLHRQIASLVAELKGA